MRNCIGTKRMALAKRRSQSAMRHKRHTAGQHRHNVAKRRGSAAGQFAVCVCNDDYPASLELRKLYPIVEDDFAARHDLLRVIDESGEDYLYPSAFVRVALPKPVEQTLHRIA